MALRFEGYYARDTSTGGSDGSSNTVAARAADDEARKLFYVAITRAQESLTFTSARYYGGGVGRKSGGAGNPEQECTFVSEAIGTASDTKHAPRH